MAQFHVRGIQEGEALVAPVPHQRRDGDRVLRVGLDRAGVGDLLPRLGECGRHGDDLEAAGVQVVSEGVAVDAGELDPDQHVFGNDASGGSEDELLRLLEPIACDREEERPGVDPATRAYNKAVLELPCFDADNGACSQRAGAALCFAHSDAVTTSSFG
jgi:hypothetical protein